MTPEKRREVEAVLDRILGRSRARAAPKVVASDGVVIRDADVQVSPADKKNFTASTEGLVQVRRADWVTVNMAAYELQQADQERERAERRALDPYGLGHWGPTDDAS